jgi:hypothetical protein|tara:strand:- start:825 stop:1238 length:414 start_codon:yes stop_codon:yes gene_type:complete
MDIKKSTINVMLDAIKRYAKEYETNETNAQIMIKASDSNCTPSYLLLIKNKIVKQITFNEILNVKIDFLGREIIVSPFIASALRRLKKQNEIEEYKNINVLVYKTKEDSKIPNLYFFNSTKPIKPISLDFIFGEEIE